MRFFGNDSAWVQIVQTQRMSGRCGSGFSRDKCLAPTTTQKHRRTLNFPAIILAPNKDDAILGNRSSFVGQVGMIAATWQIRPKMSGSPVAHPELPGCHPSARKQARKSIVVVERILKLAAFAAGCIGKLMRHRIPM